MTIARSELHRDSTFEVIEECPATIPSENNEPRFYRVMLTRAMGRLDPLYGHVVTHLRLQDWCDMKGYRLMNLYPGDRRALPGEKTDLF